MKLAFVPPRYGEQVIGGAELGCRLIAEHVASLLGWDVEVFTTCALDARTWADELLPGTTVERGVTVHRFRSRAGRAPGFDAMSDDVLPTTARPTRADQLRWIDAQGPVCVDALEAAAASGADAVVFYPYLYWPTVHGVPRLGARSVLHPAAHDEPPLRLRIFRSVMAGAGGLVFQTEGERHLVESRFPETVTRPQLLVGLGVDEGDGDEAVARAAIPQLAGGRPYVLCLGRVDRGKGTDVLAEFFATYQARRASPAACVFAGPVVHQPPDHPDVVVTGPVDEQVKWGLLRGASLVISPSPFEAFSLVVIEALVAGRPVLVNARCAATREHAERSGAGLWFDDYPTFEVVLDRLLGDEPLRRVMGARGADYAQAYRWPSVIDRYGRFVERVAERATRGAMPSPSGHG